MRERPALPEPTNREAGIEAHWGRVTETLDGALRRPDPTERARYLRQATAGDRDLRAEVEDLLRFEETAHGVLAGPLLKSGASTMEESFSLLHTGLTIGPYRVERTIGGGGMGVVALAYDPGLDRRVALKVVRGMCLSSEVLRRFETERRVLARLDHPRIARIFDGGTVSAPGSALHGRPYFAMEYVEGEPVDTWCDHRRRTVDERLEIVLEICDALAEAHRNLVVHRDLKPGNVLMTRSGQPKLLDFGIAKELGAPLEDTAVTRPGCQPLSLAYASPEQVRGRLVSVATDVYSLGVLLYRLLTGHPPYLLDGDHFENVRTICELEPPPPSSRAQLAFEVWRDGTPSTLLPAALAAARRSTPPALARRLAGDLDGIVGKALAKDPKERYRSMEQLADDLRRHLDGRPVLARRASGLYLAGKFLRRHRGRIAAAGAILAAFLALAAVGIRGQLQARASAEKERLAGTQAAEAERQAEALTLFAKNLVRATHPDVSGGRPLSARVILERGREEARRNLADEPEALAHQLEALGLAYRNLGIPRSPASCWKSRWRCAARSTVETTAWWPAGSTIWRPTVISRETGWRPNGSTARPCR